MKCEVSLGTVLLLAAAAAGGVSAFVVPQIGTTTTSTRKQFVLQDASSSSSSSFDRRSAESTVAAVQNVVDELKSKDEKIALQKKKLMDLLSVNKPQQPKLLEKKVDPILVDPLTKESLTISTKKTSSSSSSSSSSSFSSQNRVLLGGSAGLGKRGSGGSGGGINVQLQSLSNTYAGNTQTFYDLLEPAIEEEMDENEQRRQQILRNLVPLIPPPLRFVTAATGLDTAYVPMRDLFTSPAVSFAYERGWRQNFRTAGFPGPNREAQMAMDYFEPAFAKYSKMGGGTLVDMSCATGLFTRRFAKSGKYARVLGCDYSESMLTEARRRIRADPQLSSSSSSSKSLDLVRCDVGQIPMADDSITGLHAGAAMHCWPDLPKAVSEIYRVLKPGGRYYASTFLSNYFRLMQMGSSSNSNSNADSILNPVGPPSQEAFQYFESTDQLRELMESGGFEPEKISIEVLGAACVVIRCEK